MAKDIEGDAHGLPRLPSDAGKEQIKLTATYMNGIAIGLALVGGLSIPASIALSATAGREQIIAACVSLFSFCLSPYIHMRAKQGLRRLDG